MSLSAHIVRDSAVLRTARVLQMEGMFDLEPADVSRQEWDVQLDLPADWRVGLIVGPSGSGKTTIARQLWPNEYVGPHQFAWPDKHSILDAFPQQLGIKDIVGLLSSVGFSSPPAWLRPYDILSTGEQFRVDIARALAEHEDLVVIDEFTSVVDRTVAQIGSAAVARSVRKRGSRLIAVSCHYDIAAWLQPDWVYQPHVGELARGRLQRPAIELTVCRVHRSAWRLFRAHHYLNTSINDSARCFVAFWQGVPVAFSAVLHFPHARYANIKREHRTVTLPDYQGVGIGNALSAFVGSMLVALGFRYQSQTSHPAMVAARQRSALWEMIKEPTVERPRPGATSNPSVTGRGWLKDARTRLVASFEYVGPAQNREAALKLWGGAVRDVPVPIHRPQIGKRSK